MDPVPLGPLKVNHVFSTTVSVYRRQFLTFLIIGIVIGIPVALVGAAVAAVSPLGDLEDAFNEVQEIDAEDTAAFEDWFDDLVAQLDEVGEWMSIAMSSLALVVVSILGGLIVSAAVCAVVRDAHRGVATPWNASIAEGVGRLDGLFWLSVKLGALLTLGFILFVVPGVYWWILYSVAVPAFVIERLDSGASMARSHELVRGVRKRWWAVFGVSLVWLIFMGIVGGGIGAVLGATGYQSSLLGADPVSVAFSALLGPLGSIFAVVLYLALRHDLEGITAADLGPPVPPPPAPGPHMDDLL